jgi:hypothetical protein
MTAEDALKRTRKIDREDFEMLALYDEITDAAEAGFTFLLKQALLPAGMLEILREDGFKVNWEVSPEFKCMTEITWGAR